MCTYTAVVFYELHTPMVAGVAAPADSPASRWLAHSALITRNNHLSHHRWSQYTSVLLRPVCGRDSFLNHAWSLGNPDTASYSQISPNCDTLVSDGRLLVSHLPIHTNPPCYLAYSSQEMHSYQSHHRAPHPVHCQGLLQSGHALPTRWSIPLAADWQGAARS